MAGGTSAVQAKLRENEICGYVDLMRFLKIDMEGLLGTIR